MTDLSSRLSRRDVLATSAALPLLSLLPGQAAAQSAAPTSGTTPMPDPTHARFLIGETEVISLLAGSRASDNPQGTFGTNASPEDFAALAAQNFLPADRTRNFFTPVVMRHGGEVILLDTGLSSEGTGAALAGAGITPEEITLVVLSHMHGDHIGGLTGADGAPFFPKARYATGKREFDHWAGQNNEGFETKVRPLADRMTFLSDGDDVLPGLKAMLAPGHTPGHMIFVLESAGAKLALTADTANHYVFSLQRPDWEVAFDADKALAAETRKSVFGMIADEKLPFIGYHMPFPGLGFAERIDGGGFHFVPHSYQFTPA